MRSRFSSRSGWDLRPNPVSLLVEEKRRAAAPIVDLTESNPTRAGLSYSGDVILHALSGPRSLHYDPSPAGLEQARAAVAGYYAARGRHVEPERIFLTASTSEAYAWLFKLLADPGDEILVPRPSYPLFDFLATLESVRVSHYPLAEHDGWWLDFESLKSAVTGRTRAVVAVNPNNPTGSFLKREELDQMAALCRERSLAIISDEVFSDYQFGSDPRRVVSLVDGGEALTFCLSGLSKVCGLPQMKLGWLVIGGPEPLRTEAAARLEVIADTYLSVSTPVQVAAERLLTLEAGFQKQLRERLQQNLSWLRSRAAGSVCRLLDVEGGWYATLQAPRTRSEEEWVLQLLDRRSVLVQPGYFFDFPSEAFLVLSLLCRPDLFREGVDRLLAFVQEDAGFPGNSGK